MKNYVYLILVIAIWDQIHRVDSLYFHIRETERKCFIEEVPDETLVVGQSLTSLLLISIWFIIISKFKKFDRKIQGTDFQQGHQRLCSNTPWNWHACRSKRS